MSNYRFNLSFSNGSIFPPGFINNRWMVNNVSASTTNLGSTRGKGSSTRIFNNCFYEERILNDLKVVLVDVSFQFS